MASRSDGYIPPYIPTRPYKVPAGPDWVHEIKHDDGDTVRLFTRRHALTPIARGSDECRRKSSQPLGRAERRR
jgi:hypothetical protein